MRGLTIKLVLILNIYVKFIFIFNVIKTHCGAGVSAAFQLASGSGREVLRRGMGKNEQQQTRRRPPGGTIYHHYLPVPRTVTQIRKR